MKSMRLMLRFPAEQAGKPVSAQLIRNYNLDINILTAHVDPGMTGELTLELIGTEENLQAGVRFLQEEGITIVPRSIRWSDETCTHCGACTAVCPSGALTLDAESLLCFDQEKCLVCELCITACPMKALSVDYAVEE